MYTGLVVRAVKDGGVVVLGRIKDVTVIGVVIREVVVGEVMEDVGIEFSGGQSSGEAYCLRLQFGGGGGLEGQTGG